MIYIFVTQTDKDQVSNRYGSDRPYPWSSLQLVSKQVRTEVLQVLYETKTYVLRFNPTCKLPDHQVEAARHFRNIHLEIPVRAEDFETFISKTRAFRALCALSKVLNRGLKSRKSTTRINLRITFDRIHIGGRKVDASLDVLDPSQRWHTGSISAEKCKYVALYYKTQLQWLVAEWRKQLKDLTGLIVSTNADILWPNVESQRSRADRISFKDSQNSRMGTVTVFRDQYFGGRRPFRQPASVDFRPWDANAPLPGH